MGGAWCARPGRAAAPVQTFGPHPHCLHVHATDLFVEPPAPARVPGAVDWRRGFFYRQRHAGPGGGGGGGRGVFMPMFWLALPAGVLADTTDRKRLISGALLAQTGACALLALLTLAGWIG